MMFSEYLIEEPVYLGSTFSQKQEWKKIRQKTTRKEMKGIKYRENYMFSIVLKGYKGKDITLNISQTCS